MIKTSVAGLIRTKYKTLSAPQQQVADYVLANPDEVITLTLAALSAACSVSEPTVMRFLRKLGYKSYQVFRVNIAQESAQDSGQSIYSDVDLDDSAATIMEKVLSSTKCALDDLPQVFDPNAVEEICRCISGAGKVIVIGVGATAAIAFDFQHKMLRLGIEARFCNDAHIINISCNNLDGDSLLVAISHSGESREILSGVDIARENGAKVCAITSFSNSTLAKQANILLVSSSHETNFRSDAMTSRIIQLCIIDMIYIRLALQGESEAIEQINASRIAVARNKT